MAGPRVRIDDPVDDVGRPDGRRVIAVDDVGRSREGYRDQGHDVERRELATPRLDDESDYVAGTSADRRDQDDYVGRPHGRHDDPFDDVGCPPRRRRCPVDDVEGTRSSEHDENDVVERPSPRHQLDVDDLDNVRRGHGDPRNDVGRSKYDGYDEDYNLGRPLRAIHAGGTSRRSSRIGRRRCVSRRRRVEVGPQRSRRHGSYHHI